MRCPKCGFISFDHLEQCKKCGKDLAGAAADLDGTVFDTLAPVFLSIRADLDSGEEGTVVDVAVQEEVSEPDGAVNEGETGADALPDENEAELVLDDDEAELVLDADDGADVVVQEEESEVALAVSDDGVELGLEAGPETGAGDGPALELEEEPAAGDDEAEGLQLDFGDIDISDLAPPADEREREELTLDTGERAVPAMARPAAAGASSAGLEDLDVDGLDLDAPSPVVESTRGDQLPPAVKTGTALDEFDVDLGELLSGAKKEKSVDKTG